MSLPSNSLSLTLDFQALGQPVTDADIRAFTNQVYQKPRYGSVIASLTVVGFTGLILGMFAGIRSWSLLSIPIVLVLLTMLFGMVISRSLRVRTKLLAKLHKFASANNLTLLHSIANPAYSGMIFDEGDRRELSESFLFPQGLEIGNYTYDTGSGKNQKTHNWGFVRIKLTRKLPNMVLDSRKNNLFGKISNLPDIFNREQTLALEGDFNNYFTLYAPKEYERDALYVFTPDVMAAVIDAGKDYDMEVVDDNLLLYSTQKFSMDNELQLKKLLIITEKIGAKLRSQGSFYADEKVGNRAQNIVAQPGRRLKTGFNIWIVLIVIIVIAFQIWISLL